MTTFIGFFFANFKTCFSHSNRIFLYQNLIVKVCTDFLCLCNINKYLNVMEICIRLNAWTNVIYNPCYTYKFLLKTTIIEIGSKLLVYNNLCIKFHQIFSNSLNIKVTLRSYHSICLNSMLLLCALLC